MKWQQTKLVQDIDTKPPPIDRKKFYRAAYLRHKGFGKTLGRSENYRCAWGTKPHDRIAMSHGVEKEEEVEVWQMPGQKEEEERNINRQK